MSRLSLNSVFLCLAPVLFASAACAQKTTVAQPGSAPQPSFAQPAFPGTPFRGPVPGNIGMPGSGWHYSPYYYRYQYGPTFPTCGAPVPISGCGGFFRIGSLNYRFWLGPSGYYYPWGCGSVSGTPAPVYYLDQGASTPSRPPISAVLSDMEKFLAESNSKRKLKAADYDHLSRRLHDLRFKQERLLNESSGILDPADDDNLRSDLDRLSAEISRSLTP